MTGTHPFDKSNSATDEEIAELVKSIGTSEDTLAKIVFDERTDHLSPSAISLLRCMLHPHPAKRIASEQLCRNQWVQGLTASYDVLDGISGKLESYWKKEFRNNIFKKFGGVATDEQLRLVFRQIDEDSNGSIEIEELAKGM